MPDSPTQEARHGDRDAVHQLAADLRLILDTAAAGVYCVDRDGTTTLCNAAFLRMLGFEREADALGRDLHEIIHHSLPDGSRYHAAECPIYRTARFGGSAHVTTESFHRLDGVSFPVEYLGATDPARRHPAGRRLQLHRHLGTSPRRNGASAAQRDVGASN